MKTTQRDASTTRRKALKSVLMWALTAAIIAVIAYSIRDEKEKLARLLEVNPAQAALLAGVCLLLFVPSGLVRKLMARRLGVTLAFVDWYGLFMVTNLMGVVVPARGDFVLSAVYLRKKYGLPITRFVSMVYGNTVLLAVILSVEGCLGLLLLGLTEGVWDLKIWGIVFAIGVGAIPFAFLPKRLLRGENWFIKKLRAALEGWESIRSDVRLLLLLSGLIVASSMIFTIWMYASYRALRLEVGVVPVFFAGVVIQMSFFFSLTPGNLGVREAILGFVSQVLGLGFADGVAVTILQRAVSTAVFLVFGGFFSLFIVPSLVGNGREEQEGIMQDQVAGK